MDSSPGSSPLGARTVLGVEERGFYGSETWGTGQPFRWTDGDAMLSSLLTSARLPRTLEIELLSSGPKASRLTLLCNGVRLYEGEIPEGSWRRRLSLEGVPLGDLLQLELRSTTFMARPSGPAARDRRVLGIAIGGIRLLGIPEPGV